MKCDGSPQLCLKWGARSYFGRVLLPEGVNLTGYASGSAQTCTEENYRWSTHGPTFEPEDYWDAWHRPNAFHLRVEEGYTCNPSANPPVQRVGPCKPQNITGMWKYWFSQQEGDSFERIIQIGMETTETTTQQSSFTESLKEQLKIGFKIMGVGSDFTVSSQETWSTLESVSDAVSRSSSETQKRTLTGAGSYWQFVIDTTNTPWCNEPEHRIW